MDDANRASFIMKSKFQKFDTVRSDQQKGVPPPSLEKPFDGGEIIDLPPFGEAALAKVDIRDIIAGRKSLREYRDEPLSMEQLSWLLWSTQGVHGLFKNGIATRRTVPSAGARHAFETYIFVFNVTGLQSGLYRYLALEHKLGLVKQGDDLPGPLVEGCLGQAFVGRAAATFAWTVIPYRSEWRYPASAHKILFLDAGHVCQNMYLAAEAIGFGTCAIAAYDQKLMDELLGVDGEEEFTIYIAPVGKA